MADSRISDLTAATTPLAGTEEVVIVQGGDTKKVAVKYVAPAYYSFAASDEATALTVANDLIKTRIPFGMTLTGVRASLSVAGGTSGTTEIDVKVGGTSIFTTDLLTIDFGDTTSVGATTAPNITTTAIADNAEISVDVTAIAGDATEAGLKIYLIGTYS